jgi:hypothetical protein
VKRTPIQRKTPLTAKTPLSPSKGLTRSSALTARTKVQPVSRKRVGEAPARLVVREETARRANWKCEAGEMAFGLACSGDFDCHEIIQRSVRPGSHLEIELTSYVCRQHHSAVDLFPDEANRLGLLFKSWQYEEAVERRARPLPSTR